MLLLPQQLRAHIALSGACLLSWAGCLAAAEVLLAAAELSVAVLLRPLKCRAAWVAAVALSAPFMAVWESSSAPPAPWLSTVPLAKGMSHCRRSAARCTWLLAAVSQMTLRRMFTCCASLACK